MAKAKKAKLPKTIGGVKIPKELRKAGKAAKDLVQGPIVSEIVSVALLAAAASLTDDKRRLRVKAETPASGAAKEASAIGETVKRALLDAARKLLDEFDAPASTTPTSGQAKTASGTGPARTPRKRAS